VSEWDCGGVCPQRSASDFLTRAGNFAILTAILRASSLVSSLAGDRRRAPACSARNAPAIHGPSIGSALWLKKA
jgi:hypothetical protein